MNKQKEFSIVLIAILLLVVIGGIVGVKILLAEEVLNDITAPIVSISTPVEGATVFGIIQIDAVASDDVGVIGVSFKLDDTNLEVEDTTFPYSIFWNTITASNGSHTLTAVENTATSSPITVAVNNPVSTINKSLTTPSAPILKDFRFNDGKNLTEDSVAAWINTADPNKSLLFVSHKGGKVQAWNLKTNASAFSITGYNTNAVAVDQSGGALYVTDTKNNVVKKYVISNLLAGTFTPALTFGGGFPQKPHGITVSQSPIVLVYVTYLDSIDPNYGNSYVRVYTTNGTFVLEWFVVAGEIESIAVDDDNQLVHVADEKNNSIHVYTPTGTWIQDYGAGVFDGPVTDPEGIAIYKCNDDGYIIISDQGQLTGKVTEFEIFDRKTFANLARFKINNALETDGITLTQTALFNYPQGGFFAQSSNAYVEGVKWDKIANATGMTLCMDGITPSP